MRPLPLLREAQPAAGGGKGEAAAAGRRACPPPHTHRRPGPHCARGARSQAAAMAPSKSNQSAAQKREAFFGSINKEKVRE